MRAAVVIIGAGPTGMMLAIELGRRGVTTLVVADNTATTSSPKATVTQARTMEHFRRLGLAEAVRNTGVPSDHPTDIVYCTRITRHELARHRLPSPAQARRVVREQPDQWHTPELTHRSSQMWIEPLLLAACRELPSVRLALGWRVDRVSEAGDQVTVEATRLSDGRSGRFTGAYAVGCDGAASTVRDQLAIDLATSAAIQAFRGRAMFSVHARAPRLFDDIPFARGWLYAAINTTQRGSCISLDGCHFKFSFWRPAGWGDGPVTRDQIGEVHRAMFGRSCDFEVIESKAWRGGASLVAERFGRSRVLLAGDAAHLFTPSAGLGYCTGIDGATNLGWKLAAAVSGWGGPSLVPSYELECRPEAERRTRFAAECAERLALFQPTRELEEDSPEGVRARDAAAAYFADHLPRQYDIPGINFGARFDHSPIVVGEPGAPPSDDANRYTPTARPGGRAPHAWLADGRSLFDTLGRDFSLLALASRPTEVAAFQRAAAAIGIPLTVIAATEPTLRDRYEADLALIRPDQVVAWRGSTADPEAVLRTAAGW